jgi:hypothetical protein
MAIFIVIAVRIPNHTEDFSESCMFFMCFDFTVTVLRKVVCLSNTGKVCLTSSQEICENKINNNDGDNNSNNNNPTINSHNDPSIPNIKKIIKVTPCPVYREGRE